MNNFFEIYTKEELDELSKYLYYACRELDFDINKIVVLAELLGINVSQLERMISNYEEDDGLEYDNTIPSIIREKLRLDVLNPILLDYGVKSNYMWENDTQKRMVLNHIYNVSRECAWNPNVICAKAKKFGIDKNLYNLYSFLYAVLYLDMPKPQYVDHVSKIKGDKAIYDENRKKKVFLVFDKVLNTNNKDEIIKLFSSCNEKYAYFRTTINYYFRSMKDFSREEELLKKLNIYYEDYMSNRKKITHNTHVGYEVVHRLNSNSDIIEAYLNSSCISVREFCEKNNIDLQKFKNAVCFMKKHDNDYYQKYLKKIASNKKELYDMNKEDIDKVVYYIMNGIKDSDDNEVREFTIIDYYLFTDFPLKLFRALAKDGIYIHGCKEISMFLGKYFKKNPYGIFVDYTFDNPKEMEELLRLEHVINYKVDEDGKVIAGTGYIVTLEEKLELINYLKENNIPVNKVTFNTVYNKYIKNLKIELNNKSNLIRKRIK